jgi:hypothetical protein
MDWKQFIASIFGSIAWPFVFLVLIYLLRKQIPSLAERIEELTFPLGGKAKFQKKLEDGRESMERISPERRPDVAEQPVAAADDPFLQLADRYPEAAIMEAWREVEQVLMAFRHFIGSPRHYPIPRKVLHALQEAKLIDQETVELFSNLESARNLAAHLSYMNKPTTAEALEFRRQARTLADILRKVTEKWDEVPH